MRDPKILVSQELLKLVTEIDEFKGKWEALKSLSPKCLRQFWKFATSENIGSSTRIEGAELTDIHVDTLLYNQTGDEQEVAEYPETMTIAGSQPIPALA